MRFNNGNIEIVRVISFGERTRVGGWQREKEWPDNYEGIRFKCSWCSAPIGHGVSDRSLETLDRTWIMAGVATEPSPPTHPYWYAGVQ